MSTETTIHSALLEASVALRRLKDAAAYALVVISKDGRAVWEEHKCLEFEDRLVRALVEVAAAIGMGRDEQ